MSRSSVGLTLFCSLLGLLPGSVLAADGQSQTTVGKPVVSSSAQLTPIDFDAIQSAVEQTKALRDGKGKYDFSDITIPENPNTASARGEAQQLYQEIMAKHPVSSHAGPKQRKAELVANHHTFVFISRSLGTSALKSIFTTLSGDKDAVAVFRGVPEGDKIDQGLWDIQAMAKQFSPPPNIILDPTLFRDYHVTQVPVVIVTDEQSTDFLDSGNPSKVVARVDGLSDPAWLRSKVKQGQTGDLGHQGPVASISEPDLIEVMKAKMANIDWESKKKKAVANFWAHQHFQTLTPATKPRTRKIDPTVVVTQDIKSPDGTVIAAKGTRINPLNIRPFDEVVVVFDPLDKKGMAQLKEELPAIKTAAKNLHILYIATRFDKDAGWDSYKATADLFDAPVYLLTSDVLLRFKLEHTPSVITSDPDRKVFVVRELAKESDS